MPLNVAPSFPPASVAPVLALTPPEPAAGTEPSCGHCGLPVPLGRRQPSGQSFCCDGCETVFRVISGWGLGEYYEYRRDAGEGGKPAATSSKSYAELDDPAFLALYVRPAQGGLLRVELYLEGVHCSACVWLIERVPSIVHGLVEARLDAGRSLVELVYDPQQTPLSAIARQLATLGYPPHPPQGARERDLRRKEERALLGRMAVAGAVAGNVMLMAFALYGAAFQGMEREFEAFFRWGSLAITTPAVVWCAALFFRGGLAALRTRTPHMDLPISIGIASGYLWGAWNTVIGSGEIYFDTLTTLIFLLLVGRWIQRRQQHTARDAAELLYSLAPAMARLVESNAVREVPIQAVPLHAIVEVHAGEHIPVDGCVVEGRSSIDMSLLTGESRPEDVTVGSPVHAGCVNLAAPLRLRVEQTGESTRIGQLMRRVEEAGRRRPVIVQLADRISGWFVFAVLGCALATAAVWWFIDPTRAIDHAVALLVVTCPCALGMATPLAVSVALGRAARRGILVKGGDALERLAKPGLIVFDKTGTLTEGRVELLEWQGDVSWQPLVAAIEARSAHPIARAFQRAVPSDPTLVVSEFEHTLGGGIRALAGGHAVRLGSLSFVAADAQVPEWLEAAVARAAERGQTPVVIAIDGVGRALACFGDPLRPEARRCLEQLQQLGHRLAILSGDHPAVAASVARELGIEFEFVRGGATPEQKLAVIEAAATRGPVVMVGDGVNDAAALSAATVGVAVHGGAEASLAAADVFATRAGLEPLVELFRGSRRSLRVIQRGLGFSLLYNAIGVALALTGVLTPLIAAVMMPLSSLTVLTSSFRARTFPQKTEPCP